MKTVKLVFGDHMTRETVAIGCTREHIIVAEINGWQVGVVELSIMGERLRIAMREGYSAFAFNTKDLNEAMAFADADDRKNTPMQEWSDDELQMRLGRLQIELAERISRKLAEPTQAPPLSERDSEAEGSEWEENDRNL